MAGLPPWLYYITNYLLDVICFAFPATITIFVTGFELLLLQQNFLDFCPTLLLLISRFVFTATSEIPRKGTYFTAFEQKKSGVLIMIKTCSHSAD